MSLTVALALSGLEPDEQWGGELMEMYKQGSLLCGLHSPSASSIASSSGASSYYSMESGISSMSPDCNSYQHVLTKNSFETLILNALKKHESEHKINKVEVEKIETILASKVAVLSPRRRAATPPVVEEPIKELLYGGRNLLDLRSNIMASTGGWTYMPANLPDGVDCYFDNRSQYSRLQGAYPPRHTLSSCTDEDCTFVEPIYF